MESGEQWLGLNTDSERRLWEKLNPRHRRQLRLIARVLALRQAQARLPESARGKLAALADELERCVRRMEKLLAMVATRTPPGD